MYTKTTKTGSYKQDLSTYIDGYDLYNSRLLDILKDPSIETKDYIIKTNEYRPDLIAQDFYGDSKYMGIMMITCGIGLENYKRGVTLKLIPLTTLLNILNYEV
jgi:hypothetical protein